MALFDELEPPSQDKERQNNLKSGNKNPKKNTGFSFKISSKLFTGLSAASSYRTALDNFFGSTIKLFISSKYLPHVTLILLAFVVSITNLSQKIAAKAFLDEIVTVNPDVQLSVVDTVEPFTPLIKDGSADVENMILANAASDGFISSTGSVSTEKSQLVEAPVLPSNDTQTVEYVVADGDTLSGLGMKFDIKIAYLKYVNDIANENYLKPGTKLKIPPKNYSVSNTAIAKKEKERQAKLAQASRNTVTRSSSTARASGKAQAVNVSPGSKANGYPYGWCTYYVATKRFVPHSWGNAKQWLSSARSAGYATGSEPAAGAIVVTSESGWGHVAYVEKVEGGEITLSEMNYAGWGVVSRRTISADAGVIRGYVY